MIGEFSPVGIDEMPLAMGVYEHNGDPLPPLDIRALTKIDQPPNEVTRRGATAGADFLAVSDIDPNVLSDAGWGIVFPENVDPAVRSALTPLIEHRRSQVFDTRLFRIFEGKAGYEATDNVRSWLAKSNVGFAVVDPLQGVPLYLLLIGSPKEIPFEFQYVLDAYWSVGRLSFERAEHYRSYVDHLIAYETAVTLQQKRRVALFNPKNAGDRATALLHDFVAEPLAKRSPTSKPLGEKQGFELLPLLASEATKQNLLKLFLGELPGGPASVLFTGSHGLALEPGDRQLARQGAIVCQEWEGGKIDPMMAFAAEDLPSDARVQGLIHFLFACYGGGCPRADDYQVGPTGGPRVLAGAPFVARLPQELLTAGALAVLAHIDRAWSYSFIGGRSVSQVQEFRDVLVRLLKGERIGQAVDQFNLRWAVLSAELMDAQRMQTLVPGQVSDAVLANRWVARNDARNYLVYGDPAVRLRIEAML